jgi:hypothetical protein
MHYSTLVLLLLPCCRAAFTSTHTTQTATPATTDELFLPKVYTKFICTNLHYYIGGAAAAAVAAAAAAAAAGGGHGEGH